MIFTMNMAMNVTLPCYRVWCWRSNIAGVEQYKFFLTTAICFILLCFNYRQLWHDMLVLTFLWVRSIILISACDISSWHRGGVLESLLIRLFSMTHKINITYNTIELHTQNILCYQCYQCLVEYSKTLITNLLQIYYNFLQIYHKFITN